MRRGMRVPHTHTRRHTHSGGFLWTTIILAYFDIKVTIIFKVKKYVRAVRLRVTQKAV